MKKIYPLLLIGAFYLNLQAQSTCDPPLKTGLIAYYPFCDSAKDAGGNGLHGQVSGAGRTTDRFGVSNRAYSFNGSGSYIGIPQLTGALDQAFTVSAWLLNRKSTLGINGIYHGAATGEWVVYNHAFAVHLSDGNWHTCEAGLFDTVWTHVAATYEKGESIMIYVNGVLKNSTKIPDVELFNADGYLSTIGSYNRGSDNFWEGKIDDVAVYSRKLNQREIDTLYHAGGWLAGKRENAATAVKVYPNPVKGKVYIIPEKPETADLIIISPGGRMVLHETMYDSPAEIDLSGWSPGIYILQIMGKEGLITHRLVVY